MVCLDAKVIIIWAVIIRLSSRCLSLCFPMTHSPVSGRILPLSLWSLSGMLPNSMGVHLICSFPAYIKSYILPWHPASRGQYYSSYQTGTWPQNCHVLHNGPGSAMLTPFYFFPHILYTPMYFKNFVSIFLCQNLSLKLRGTFLSKCGLRIISQLVVESSAGCSCFSEALLPRGNCISLLLKVEHNSKQCASQVTITWWNGLIVSSVTEVDLSHFCAC